MSAFPTLKSGKPCMVAGCERRVRRVGLCYGHLRRGPDAPIATRFPQSARDSEGRKRCNVCEEWLPVDSFTQDRRARDGRRSVCLHCHAARRRLYKYGVTSEWLTSTLRAQGGGCAICQSPTPRGRGWAIDHDHACCPEGANSCGRCVRGILCNPCNLGLGQFKDDPGYLLAAATYLHSSAERLSIVRGV